MRVLLVESDRSKSAKLAAFLNAEGVNVDTAESGEEAFNLLKHYEADLMLLNLALPDMPGSTLISRIRAARRDIPVLALSASPSVKSRLRALAAGADDVVERTIDHDELLARTRAIVRRSRGYNPPKLQVGALTLDLQRQEVVANGNVVSLTVKEFAVLQLLVTRKNTIMTKEAILTNIYGGMDEPELKIIDVFICKLRKKLAGAGLADVIGTVWGRGYMVRDLPRDRNTPTEPRIPQPTQRTLEIVAV